MKKKLMIGLGVVAAIVAVMAYQFLTPKGEVDISSAAVAYEVSATKLYAAFEEDEAAANTRYANAIMTVKGKVTSVEAKEDGQLQVSLDAGSPLGAVVCSLQESSLKGNKLEAGNEITVKGVCTGFLFDVVIDRAILIS